MEVTRAPHALALLNNGQESLKSQIRPLSYIDRGNNSLNTLDFVEEDASVEKMLTDFSWLLPRVLDGRNYTSITELYSAFESFGYDFQKLWQRVLNSQF